MRWVAVLLVIYLLPVLAQPSDRASHFWSLALADDDDDDDDDDDGDDDDDDDDDDGGGVAGGGGGNRNGGGGGEGGGGPAPFGFLNSLFDDDDRGFLDDEVVAIGLDALDVAALELVGFRVIEEVDLGTLDLSIARLSAPAGFDAPGAVSLAQATRPDGSFDLNHLYRGNAMDCGAERCWAGHMIGLEEQAVASCTARRSVAIIDTPVDTRHVALETRRVEQQTFRPSGSRAAPSDHGTAVAALLVGQGSGGFQSLMPQAQLLAADVFYLLNGEVRSDALTILRALDWAIESEAEVVAFSFSGKANAALGRGIEQAARRASLVAAAGNNGPAGEAAFPAAYQGVLAVTAVDARKRSYRNANRGSYIELAAPGVEIVSARAEGGFDTWSGTSFAVPFAAAALLHARALTGGDAARARALLAETAEDLGPMGRDEVYGWGLLRHPKGACD